MVPFISPSPLPNPFLFSLPTLLIPYAHLTPHLTLVSTLASFDTSILIPAFRKAVIAHTSDYVTTLSTILYSDFETIVFLKKEVMMVLSNGGSTGNTYSVTIPMGNTFQAGTEFTDIIGCGKVKVASTGDFIANIVNGMPQVRLLSRYPYPVIPIPLFLSFLSPYPYPVSLSVSLFPMSTPKSLLPRHEQI